MVSGESRRVRVIACAGACVVLAACSVSTPRHGASVSAGQDVAPSGLGREAVNGAGASAGSAVGTNGAAGPGGPAGAAGGAPAGAPGGTTAPNSGRSGVPPPAPGR